MTLIKRRMQINLLEEIYIVIYSNAVRLEFVDMTGDTYESKIVRCFGGA